MILSFLSRIFSKKTNTSKVDTPSLYTKNILGKQEYIRSIGDFTYGKPKIYHWGENASLIIGNFCSLADGTIIILGGNHRTDWVTTYPFGAFDKEWQIDSPIIGHPSTKGDITIGNDVWIATGAIILSGTTIGDGAVIGANAIVSSDIPPYSIVVGNPGKVIKKRFSEEEINDLLSIAWWNWDKEKINSNIHLLSQPNIQAFIKLHKTH